MTLKILFLSYRFYPDVGGIERNSEVLANAFAAAGHQVKLLTWSIDKTDKAFPFSVIRSPNPLRLMLSYTWADCIFENNPSLQLDWPGIFFKRPSIVVLHTWISRLNGKIGFRDYLKFRRIKQANKVITVSEALRQRCWQDATVIGNPYPEDEFQINPSIARTLDFVFLGRLVSDKGADQAILAVHRLTELAKTRGDAARYTLTIIGDGPERQNLVQLVSSLNLVAQVHFTGTLLNEELSNCLNRHRFILVPSIWEEPFGNVVLEGMACGCLPITSDGGGLPEAVGKAGLTYRRGSLEALVECVQGLLDQPILEHQLRAAIPAHLVVHQQGVIANRYLAVINSC